MTDPAPRTAPARPRWAAAGLMVGLLAALVAAPLALDAALPDLPNDRVGVFERVRLAETGSRGTARAAFIAPAGWVWVGGRDSGLFTTPDGRDTVGVTLHTDVADPDALLRTGVPVGAATLPAGSRLTHSQLAISALEYDLAAGDNPVIAVVACTHRSPAECVAVLGTFSAGDEAERDRTEHALIETIASIEVLE